MDAGYFDGIQAINYPSTSVNYDIQEVAIVANYLSNSLQLSFNPWCYKFKRDYQKHQEFHGQSCVCQFEFTVILHLIIRKIKQDSNQITRMIHLVNAEGELHFDQLLESEKEWKVVYLLFLIQWVKLFYGEFDDY